MKKGAWIPLALIAVGLTLLWMGRNGRDPVKSAMRERIEFWQRMDSLSLQSKNHASSRSSRKTVYHR